MSSPDTPEQLRKLAQETRDIAARVSLATDRAALLKMAERYETMAKQLERQRRRSER
jgi:hypothetical protein